MSDASLLICDAVPYVEENVSGSAVGCQASAVLNVTDCGLSDVSVHVPVNAGHKLQPKAASGGTLL